MVTFSWWDYIYIKAISNEWLLVWKTGNLNDFADYVSIYVRLRFSNLIVCLFSEQVSYKLIVITFASCFSFSPLINYVFNNNILHAISMHIYHLLYFQTPMTVFKTERVSIVPIFSYVFSFFTFPRTDLQDSLYKIIPVYLIRASSETRADAY